MQRAYFYLTALCLRCVRLCTVPHLYWLDLAQGKNYCLFCIGSLLPYVSCITRGLVRAEVLSRPLWQNCVC
jgi:hypothetical protein